MTRYATLTEARAARTNQATHKIMKHEKWIATAGTTTSRAGGHYNVFYTVEQR